MPEMCKRLASGNTLTPVGLFFLCIRRTLPFILLFQVIAFGSLAQTREEALIADSLIEHGQVTIPFKDEAEALTFEPVSSTWVKQIKWNKAAQQVKTATGKTAQVTVFSTLAETPSQWLGKEQFLVILSPKTSFTIEVNGYKSKLASPGVDTQIRISPFLKAKGGATTIKITSEQDAGDIDSLAYRFFLIATPDIRFVASRVRVFHTYPENYRGLNWSYRFRMKNHAQSPRYASFIRREEKVRDFSGKVVTHIIADSTKQGNQEPIKGHHHFFYVNREVYSYKWTAETPNLFLVTSGAYSSRYNASEVISEKVGLRIAELKKGELRINNIPVRLKAVAYIHPPLRAPAPTTEELRTYVIKLKQHHFNTIRVYGLPANNDLYDLADEYGLYLIQYLDVDQEPISEGDIDGNIWLKQRLSMLYQLRNRPSLIAWATENNIFDAPKPWVSALQDSLKVLDPERPVLNNIKNKAIANLPPSAPQLEQFSAESLQEFKKEYQPVSIKLSKDNSINVVNLQDFAVLDKVLLQWKILDGEKVVQQGEINDLSIKPGNSQVIKLPFSFDSFEKDSYRLRFELLLQENLPWADKGFVSTWEEFLTHNLHQLRE
ncbi:DUF4981 domain-containing protein [Pontibacter diazotrophicus]|uniref:beta-galactosidase n=1 Tax=Pontibacter diazotrophicus TaxID=1400979 RepID=A0A3D8LE08_9BACT|nr:DUF4981 domain-containing protein [Pontibacter diazotrophicus]RDV15699.1 DUF4981 domain-containing protein [Pontibacter diazotrophicus]